MEKVLKENPIPITTTSQLVVGHEVMDLISDPGFQARWNSLYESCPWATVFQGPEFVTQWYSLYHKIYVPILVYAQCEGKLTGMITLARGKKNAGIMAAGRTDAHYQVWISEDAHKESFIKAALQLLRRRFKKEDIMLVHLPPDAPIDWIKTEHQWSSCCDLMPINRPLIDLDRSTIDQLTHKKQFKLNRNRFSRLGELKLEKITETEQFESILDDLALQYDFRQGATYNRTPFKSNPLKKVFYINLFKKKMLFVAVLYLDKEVVASIVSSIGLKGYIHGAGINSQSPHYTKFSPGFVNFIMFSEQLFEEGYKFLDLSTGGQSYKNRLASTSDTVFRLIVSPRPPIPLIRKTGLRLHKSLNDGLNRLDIDPKKVKAYLNKNSMLVKEKLSLIKNHGISPWFKYRFLASKHKATCLYEIGDSLDLKAEADSFSISKNFTKDLLDFEPDGTLLTKWEFLYGCLKRIEGGEIFFTWTLGGRLMACIWLSDKLKEDIIPKDKIPQKEISLLYGLYVHEKGRKDLGTFLTKVKEEATKIKLEHQIYFLEKRGFESTCPNLEAVGL